MNGHGQIGNLSKRILIELLECVDASLKCSDLKSFDFLIKRLQSFFEHEYAIGGIVHLKRSMIENIISVVNIDYPMEWMELYFQNEFQFIDPITRFNFTNFKPQIWSETYRKYSAEKSKFVAMAGEFGLREGISHGVMDTVGLNGSIFSFAGGSFKPTSDHLNILEIIIPHLHQALLRIAKKTSIYSEDDMIHPLSTREKEVLKWMRIGKTNWEISVILEISERTVKFHVSNIMKKLNTQNRCHAIAKALDFNIISI
jgi:DNA-binding CsgD family transcriptional regulator